MKQQLSKIIFVIMAMVFITVSGGATIYSHFCKSDNFFAQGFSKVEHTCKTEVVAKSCHKSEPSNGCHDTVPDEKDCCDSSVEHEFVEQVISPVQSFEVILPELAVLYDLLPVVHEEAEDYSFIDESPPLHRPPLVIQLQQWLC